MYTFKSFVKFLRKMLLYNSVLSLWRNISTTLQYANEQNNAMCTYGFITNFDGRSLLDSLENLIFISSIYLFIYFDL